MLRFLAFLGIFGAVLALGHFYVWARIVRDTGLPPAVRSLLAVAMATLCLAIPLQLVARRIFPRQVASATAWPVYVWMGLFFFLFVLCAASDGLRLIAAIVARAAGRGEWLASPERRLFLARLAGGTVATAAASLAAVAMRQALGRVAIRRVEVTLAGLPAELDGTTIVQLTDMHLGPTLGRSFVEEIVAQTNTLEPDLVAITGDLVDGSVEDLRQAVEPLGGLRSRQGTFFVTGNHEYYLTPDGVSGADAWIHELGALGIRTLRNERVSIGVGAAVFDLAGVDDWSARDVGRGHGPDLARALEERDPSRALVLLAHQPRQIREAARHGVGLQLSGHTHGGQFWPWHLIVGLFEPYVAGLARHEDTWIYVSRGTGYWGPPMRLAAPAEITRIVLRSVRVRGRAPAPPRTGTGPTPDLARVRPPPCGPGGHRGSGSEGADRARSPVGRPDG